jgi:hypothetical protein
VDFEVILFGPKTSDQCPMSEQDSEPWRKIPRASHQTQGVLFLQQSIKGKPWGMTSSADIGTG